MSFLLETYSQGKMSSLIIVQSFWQLCRVLYSHCGGPDEQAFPETSIRAKEPFHHSVIRAFVCACCVTDMLHLLFPGHKCWGVNQLFGGERDRKGRRRHRKLITLVCERPSKKALWPKPLHVEEMFFSCTRDWPVMRTIPASPCLSVCRT